MREEGRKCLLLYMMLVHDGGRKKDMSFGVDIAGS